ncbi:MAG: glutamine synthetase III [Candidatus Kapaibacteriales bacterium]
MSIRQESLSNVRNLTEDQRFASNPKTDRHISEYYGEWVFGPEAIKKYTMRDAYDNLMKAVEHGHRIDQKTADFVAVGMKNWAMDRGATHFTHWFQPLTGKTAEKHDSFFKLDKTGKAIESFSGSILIKQETDGSSFPSGGLRQTHAARGYTVWDPSSFAFIMESSHGKTLYIPAIFISYTGEALDLKTPLLKSVHFLDTAATKVCQMFDPHVQRVNTTLGWEQEYFIVDEALHDARPDLVLCGRTLFGNASARGQQLDDHYFGSIPERVQDFMHDFEDDCLMLGIPITTRHNEVAPTQFECAPNFENANLAADHNQLLMSIIDRIAKRHKLRALLHEKPYAGINGSGKHNNWSMATDTGVNLLSPGDNPAENLQFLTFFINTIKAVADNTDLMIASILTAGNEHRLGANEAPPSIISVYTGDYLENVLEGFLEDKPFSVDRDAQKLTLNLPKIATIELDETDRNRTSPFPFTGNRFEFRAVGSSVNVSNPMTVLNCIVAKQLSDFSNEVEKKVEAGQKQNEAIIEILKRYYKEAKNIVFNGDGYSDEWVEEAKKRGLSNIKSSPEAQKVFLSDQAKEVFVKTGIFTENELKGRYNVNISEYIEKVEIEVALVAEIANTHIIPAAVKYQKNLIKYLQDLDSIKVTTSANNIKKKIEEIAGLIDKIAESLDRLQGLKEEIDGLEDVERAMRIHSDVKPAFKEIRSYADKLELLVDDEYWPLPKYRELLFLS